MCQQCGGWCVSSARWCVCIGYLNLTLPQKSIQATCKIPSPIFVLLSIPQTHKLPSPIPSDPSPHISSSHPIPSPHQPQRFSPSPPPSQYKSPHPSPPNPKNPKPQNPKNQNQQTATVNPDPCIMGFFGFELAGRKGRTGEAGAVEEADGWVGGWVGGCGRVEGGVREEGGREMYI